MTLHDRAEKRAAANREQTRKALGITPELSEHPDDPGAFERAVAPEPIKVPEGGRATPAENVALPGDSAEYRTRSSYEGYDGEAGEVGPGSGAVQFPEGRDIIHDFDIVDASDDGIIHNEDQSWEALPAIDYTQSGIAITPATATLEQAWSAVMAEVQEIRKADRFSGGGASYVYRGVDAVINAVGPALRKHRVSIVPIKIEPSYRDVHVGSKGTPMRECTVRVTYQIRSASGQSWIVMGVGESVDSSDKGTTKACTVAYRNMLLTALSVPVDNPRLDPDHVNYQRGVQPPQPTRLPEPRTLRDEVLKKDVTWDRLNIIYGHINPADPKARFPQLGRAVVKNEEENDESLAHLVWRLRAAHPDAPKRDEGRDGQAG